MIDDKIAYTAINAASDMIADAFVMEGASLQLAEQKKAFADRELVSDVLTDTQKEAHLKGEEFRGDLNHAKALARPRIHAGVSKRLKGAYAAYAADNELECIRHIMLAMQSICIALGWSKAVSYIESQNVALIKMSKELEEA